MRPATLALLALLVCGSAAADKASQVKQLRAEKLDAKVAPHYQLLNKYPVNVIVQFDPPGRTELKVGRGSPENRAARQEKTQQAGSQLTGRLTADGLKVLSPANNIPWILVLVPDEQAMLKLLRDPWVTHIIPEYGLKLDFAQAGPIVGAPTSLSTGVARGAGSVIAIIDTGVDRPIPNLIESVDMRPTDLEFNNHGSAVALLAGKTAPDAKLVSIRIGGSRTNLSTFALRDAIDWVLNNKDRLKINVVNMSLTSNITQYNTDCSTPLSDLLYELVYADIVPVVSSGNGGTTNSLPEPACSPHAIAVGSTMDSNGEELNFTMCRGQNALTQKNVVDCFSNSGASLDIVAPGCIVDSGVALTGEGNVQSCGTSFAAPIVSGAVAIIRGTNGTVIEPMQVIALAKSDGGVYNKDPKNNLVRSLLSIPVFLNAALTMYPPVAGGTLTPTETLATVNDVVAPLTVIEPPTPAGPILFGGPCSSCHN